MSRPTRRPEAAAHLLQHYTDADLGPMCRGGCHTRLPIALANTGVSVHPTCSPEWKELTERPASRK